MPKRRNYTPAAYPYPPIPPMYALPDPRNPNPNLTPAPTKSPTRRRRKNPMPVPTRFRSAASLGLDAAMDEVANGLERVIKNTVSNLINGAIERGVNGLTRNLGGVGSASSKVGKAGGETAWPEWAQRVLLGEYGVVLSVGARDSGKTTAVVSMAEFRQQQLGTNIYFVNYPAQLAPDHIVPVPAEQLDALFDGAEVGATIIIDDASTLLNSKRTMTNRGIGFETTVNTVAHKGILLLLTVQDSSDINKAGLRADMYAFKPPERAFLETERPRMRIISQYALDAFSRIPTQDWVKWVYLWVNEQANGLVEVKRPEWMDRAHAKYRRLAQGRGAGFAAQNSNRARSGQTVVEGEYVEVDEARSLQHGRADGGDYAPNPFDSPLL